MTRPHILQGAYTENHEKHEVLMLRVFEIQDPVWKHRKNRHDHSNPNFDYEAWKKKHMAFAGEHVPGWIEEVKKEYGKPNTKYACVG